MLPDQNDFHIRRLFSEKLIRNGRIVVQSKCLYFCRIKSENRFEPGQTIWNLNKNIRFDLQLDGKAVLTRTCDKAVIWQTTPTVHSDSSSASVEMQRDENLVLLQSDGTILWQSDTKGDPFAGSLLRVINSGALCLFKGGACLWASDGVSGNCRPTPSPPFQGPKSSGIRDLRYSFKFQVSIESVQV